MLLSLYWSSAAWLLATWPGITRRSMSKPRPLKAATVGPGPVPRAAGGAGGTGAGGAGAGGAGGEGGTGAAPEKGPAEAPARLEYSLFSTRLSRFCSPERSERHISRIWWCSIQLQVVQIVFVLIFVHVFATYCRPPVPPTCACICHLLPPTCSPCSSLAMMTDSSFRADRALGAPDRDSEPEGTSTGVLI